MPYSVITFPKVKWEFLRKNVNEILFLAYVSGKMAKDMPNDRLNRAKHAPLSGDWQQQFASVAQKRIDL